MSGRNYAKRSLTAGDFRTRAREERTKGGPKGWPRLVNRCLMNQKNSFPGKE